MLHRDLHLEGVGTLRTFVSPSLSLRFGSGSGWACALPSPLPSPMPYPTRTPHTSDWHPRHDGDRRVSFGALRVGWRVMWCPFGRWHALIGPSPFYDAPHLIRLAPSSSGVILPARFLIPPPQRFCPMSLRLAARAHTVSLSVGYLPVIARLAVPSYHPYAVVNVRR